MPLIRKVSLTNFVIASSALAFQVFVLYPWHQQLDDDFKLLEQRQLQSMKLYETERLEVLKAVQKDLEELKSLKKSWWR